MGLKKGRLILLVIVAMVSVLIVYRLHEIKRPQVVFSDDGIISNDGGGPYENGVQGVRIDVVARPVFLMEIKDSSRFVYVKFEDTYWRGENLEAIASKLPSKNYWITLVMELPGKSLLEMNIGEHLEPQFGIVFWNANTGEEVCFMVTYLYGGESRIPPSLYEDGHLEVVRVNENTWVVDVDAWFSAWTGSYYVRLSFKITVNMKHVYF